MSLCNIFDILPHSSLFQSQQNRDTTSLRSALPGSTPPSSSSSSTGSLAGSPSYLPTSATFQHAAADSSNMHMPQTWQDDDEWSRIRRRLWNAKQPTSL
ncbi:hypothetical protein J3B02_006056, partial [Coemansia erecta]